MQIEQWRGVERQVIRLKMETHSILTLRLIELKL